MIAAFIRFAGMRLWNNIAALQIAAVVSTLVLTIGAVIEYWANLKLLALLSLKWLLRKSTPFERCAFKKLFLHAIGPILVVMGIAGEVVFEGRDFVLEDEQEGQSQQTIQSLKATVSGNEKEAAQLRKDAEGLKERAEAEQLERRKLEAVVAPRGLSLDQQRKIAAACKEFRGHNVLVSAYGIDGEAAALGGQIISTLRSADITVLDNRGRGFSMGAFDVGVHIRNPSGANTENDFVVSLGKALSMIGELKVSVNDPWPKATGLMFGGGEAYPKGTIYVDIMVGVKPLPVLPAHK